MLKPTRAQAITFGIGAVTALAAAAFSSSKSAHRLAVRGVAGGLKLKDDILQKVETIREEAADIYEEARREPDGTEE